tara:strand:+ start:43 stop:789 length:747 start_codon:yes stop_codon:yes gene_type:complete
MRKILLTFIIATFFISFSEAQSCTPDNLYQDSSFGIWPDTAQDLPPAAAGVAYSTDINFICPDNVTTELDPSGQFVGNPIDEFTVTSVDGLPNGITYACNESSCVYDGGELGCANIYGTTDSLGTFPLTINVDVVVLVTVFGVTAPVTQSESFGGYELIVGTAGTIQEIITPITIAPNPGHDNISIKGITSKMKADFVEIVNLNGQIAQSQAINSSNCDINIKNLDNGIYIARVHYLNGIKNIRFIKN